VNAALNLNPILMKHSSLLCLLSFEENEVL
jgi:hypothetical protein